MAFGKKKKQEELIESTEMASFSVDTVATTENMDDGTVDFETGIDLFGDAAVEDEVDENAQMLDLGNDSFGMLTHNPDGTEVIVVEPEVFSTIADKDGYYELHERDTEGNDVVRHVKVQKRQKRGKRRVRNYKIGELTEDNYGPLLEYVQDSNVTDINWNGKELWIDDLTKKRYLSDVHLPDDFVRQFTVRVANSVSKQFNQYNPTLESETQELRITIVHESVSNTGRTISIRKTPGIRRISFQRDILEATDAERYCALNICTFLSNSVKAKQNIVIAGLTGVGKTELVKFLTNYILPEERAITIEDTLEIHYKEINPGKDCVELKVNDKGKFTYTDAIKSCMRLLPRWILLSEARSIEVKYLLESMSTGAKCITTLHTDDVRKIPDRVLNMIGDIDNKEAILDSVHKFFNIGVLVDKRFDEETHKVHRFVSQVCVFYKEGDENKCMMIADQGKLLENVELPEAVLQQYKIAGIRDPFVYTFIN